MYTSPPHHLPNLDDDEYRPCALLARGGMGELWKAERSRDHQLKVIKIASPGHAARLHREVASLARMDHPNVIRLERAGGPPDRPYYVMDYYERGDLRKLTHREGPCEPAVAVARGCGFVAGLAHAHQLELVHRDTKLANILVAPDGRLILADWGAVRDLKEESELTGVGFAIGTRGYMSPEQARGEAVGKAADVYAAGRVLQEMMGEKIRMASAALRSVLRRCLAESEAERYPDAAALDQDLRALLGR